MFIVYTRVTLLTQSHILVTRGRKTVPLFKCSDDIQKLRTINVLYSIL